MPSHWRKALAGAALAGLITGPPAARAQDRDWYVRVLGGVTFPHDDDFVVGPRGDGPTFDSEFSPSTRA